MKKSLAVLGIAILVAGSAGAQGMMKGGHHRGYMPCANQSAPYDCPYANATFGGGQYMRWDDKGMGMMPYLRGVNLSAQQQNQVRAIRDEMRSQMAQLWQNSGLPVESYLASGTFDKNAFIADRSALVTKTIELRATCFEKIYNLLTEEQKKQIADTIGRAK